MNSWVDFWNGEHSIYVNEKHKLAHSRKVFNDINKWLSDETCSVMDYGCGEALYAEELQHHCKNLVLIDASENIVGKLRSRTIGQKSVQILHISECNQIKDNTFDLIIVNSVFQYLNGSETKDVLLFFRRILKKNGKLVIADIIPPNHPILKDVISLLKFALINRFLLVSLIGLFKTYFSEYTHLRKNLGLSFYAPQNFIEMLSNRGFRARLESENFGHNQNRVCFTAEKI